MFPQTIHLGNVYACIYTHTLVSVMEKNTIKIIRLVACELYLLGEHIGTHT